MSSLSYNHRRILGSLSQSPKTKTELMEAIGLTDSAVLSILRKLKAKGLIRVCGSKANRGTQPSPVYAAMADHDMPADDEAKRKTGKNAQRLESIKEAIRENGPMTAEDLAQWLDVKRSNINSAVVYYREGGRTSTILRIASWTYVDKPRCGWTPMYGMGPGRDAEKPQVDRREYMAKWRERNRARTRVRDAALRKAAGARSARTENPFGQLLAVAGVTAHPKKSKDTKIAEAA